MPWPSYHPRPEPRTTRGEVLLYPHHIALLQGLLDRPRAIAVSYRDWVRAALPYMPCGCSQSARKRAFRAIQSIHPEWVARMRLGRCIVAQLTERGRAILELRVPARIHGQGPYRGMRRVGRG